jgi:hypothetical protein
MSTKACFLSKSYAPEQAPANGSHFYKDTVRKVLPFGIVADPQMVSNFATKELQKNPGLEEKLFKHKVAQFTDHDRLYSQILFNNNGSLEQIGRDDSSENHRKMAKGIYIYVIKNDKLYLSPKIDRQDGSGKIQHSSFFCGAPVDYAGSIILDKKGKIVAITNSSGHYKPEAKQFKDILNEFFKPKIPEKDFNKIRVSTSLTFASFSIAKIFSKCQFLLNVFYSSVASATRDPKKAYLLDEYKELQFKK